MLSGRSALGAGSNSTSPKLFDLASCNVAVPVPVGSLGLADYKVRSFTDHCHRFKKPNINALKHYGQEKLKWSLR